MPETPKDKQKTAKSASPRTSALMEKVATKKAKLRSQKKFKTADPESSIPAYDRIRSVVIGLNKKLDIHEKSKSPLKRQVSSPDIGNINISKSARSSEYISSMFDNDDYQREVNTDDESEAESIVIDQVSQVESPVSDTVARTPPRIMTEDYAFKTFGEPQEGNRQPVNIVELYTKWLDVLTKLESTNINAMVNCGKMLNEEIKKPEI